MPPKSTIDAAPLVTNTAPMVFLFIPRAANAGPINAKHNTPSPTAEVITMETALPSKKAKKTKA